MRNETNCNDEIVHGRNMHQEHVEVCGSAKCQFEQDIGTGILEFAV